MKLATFRTPGKTMSLVGALVTLDGTDYLADVSLAYGAYLRDIEEDPMYRPIAILRVPPDVVRLLEGGAYSMDAARNGVEHVQAIAASVDSRALLEAEGVLVRVDKVSFLPCVPRPPKFISLGLNYPQHLEEEVAPGLERPAFQTASGKFSSTLCGHEHPVVHPAWTTQLDYEIEVCLVIGERCKNVRKEEWRSVVAGLTIFNDISARDVQFPEMASGLLCAGQNFDTAGPLGPYLVTLDEIPDPGALDLELRVNGEVRQQDNTRAMVHTFGDIIEYWSSKMTLEPGDVISTGSPRGVAYFRQPNEPFFLHAGDVVEAEVQQLGVLRNRIISAEDWAKIEAAL